MKKTRPKVTEEPALHPSINRLAKAMQQKLDRDEGKGPWLKTVPADHLHKLLEEVSELARAPNGEWHDEAADVANFAMFFADAAEHLHATAGKSRTKKQMLHTQDRQMILASAEQRRISPDMTIDTVLTVLGENGIKVWSLRAPPFGEVVFFLGRDAAKLRAKSMAACFGEKAKGGEQ